MPVGRLILAYCVLCLALGDGARCRAEGDPDLINIRETNWGFEGTVVKKTHMPVAFLVQNNSPSTTTITFELTRLVGFGRPIGTVLKQEVTFSGETERWVQFTPYVEDDLDTWTLKWGPKSTHQMTLPQAKAGPKSTVLVYDREAVTPPAGPLRRMSEELFPNSVTGTAGLRGVLLDRAPRWQGARVRAFLDWLQSGGKVFILQQDNGTYPTFLEPLEILNRTQERYFVGAGEVRRIPRSVDQIDLDYAREHLFNDPQTIIRRRPAEVGWNTLTFTSGLMWDRELRMQYNLVSLARFRRNWPAIYLSAIVYLLVLWPGCYRVGRLAKDFRWFYVAFGAAIVCFSLLFIGLGRVGATIQNRARAVAVARHLTDGAFDITQWTTVAVTGGGAYDVRNQGSGFCYSNSNELETVLGTFHVGDQPRAEFFLPPSATRNVIHRCRLNTSRPAPTLTRLEQQDAQALSVEFSTAGTFADQPDAALVVWNNTAYPLRSEPGRLLFDERGKPQDLIALLTETDSTSPNRPVMLWMRTPRYYDEKEDDRSQRLIFDDTFVPLLSHACDARDVGGTLDVQLPAHMARLVVYARMPEEFYPEAATYPDRDGRVLFCFDYPLAGPP